MASREERRDLKLRDIWTACTTLAGRLEALDKKSLQIVFSGPAGAILWANALVKEFAKILGIDESGLREELGCDPGELRRNTPTPIVAVVYGCAEAERDAVLSALFPRDDERPEYNPHASTVDCQYIESPGRPHHPAIIVDCSITFHHEGVLPATRLRLWAYGGGKELLVATANPAQLVVEAFRDIESHHSHDPALMMVGKAPVSSGSLGHPPDDSNVETIILLFKLARLLKKHDVAKNMRQSTLVSHSTTTRG
ncbi:hypothetical protein JCM16303_004507 [Sporobolomyces ruberrimus]